MSSAKDDLKRSYPEMFLRLMNLVHYMDDHEGLEYSKIDHSIIPEEQVQKLSFLVGRLAGYFNWRTDLGFYQEIFSMTDNLFCSKCGKKIPTSAGGGYRECQECKE